MRNLLNLIISIACFSLVGCNDTPEAKNDFKSKIIGKWKTVVTDPDVIVDGYEEYFPNGSMKTSAIITFMETEKTEVNLIGSWDIKGKKIIYKITQSNLREFV